MRLLSLTLVAALGCSATPAPGLDAAVSDLGGDARDLLDRADVAAPQRIPLGGGCATDAQCDDGVFCNGAERCEQGRCVAGLQGLHHRDVLVHSALPLITILV